ncbi:MAG: class I SAM-dependent methyltransferase [Chloroflexi bacterium]|nr:class I SAM-dependent methyltransferase [Chloroflexota bacterium]MYK35386.1 class I SAM-dependent methyltransferase [Chloroflexota bacterium]
MRGVDFGHTAADYATHRAGFPDSFFDLLEQHVMPIQGARAVDLGTGTGSVARTIAVRGAASVIGVDPSDALTSQARNLDKAAGVQVGYVHTTAESTGLPSDSFDLVIAAQCWWWFEAQAAAMEAHRLLAPGGHIVIASLDWLPLPGSVPEATEQLIRQANPGWTLYGGTGRHPGWLDDLKHGGFSNVRSFEYDIDIPYTHEAWRGRIRASAGIGATLAPAQVAAFDRTHADMLAERFPDDPLPAPHRIYAAIGRRTE